MLAITQQSSWFSPLLAGVTITDMSGVPLGDTTVTLTPTNFTAPSNWQQILLNINPSVQFQNTSVYGTTGIDGHIVFPVMQYLEYTVNVNGVALNGESVPNITFNTYITQPETIFQIPTTTNYGAVQTTPPSNQIAFNVSNASYNATWTFYNVTYNDPTSKTSAITFFIQNQTGAYLYNQTVTGSGANSATFSNLSINPSAGSIQYGFQATTSYGDMYQTGIVDYGNAVVVFGQPYDTWLCLGLLILLGSLFSYTGVPIGNLVVIGMCGFMAYGIKMLQVQNSSQFGVILFILGIYSVLAYIRKKEDVLT